MRKVLLFSWLIFFASSLPGYGNGEKFTIITENAAVTNFINDDSKLVGSSVEIILEILNRLHWPTHIEVYPWARAYNTALQGPKVALFSTTRTEEHEHLFKWVGPIFEQRQVLCKAASSPLQIKRLDDARNVKAIGTYYNDVSEQMLKKTRFAAKQDSWV